MHKVSIIQARSIFIFRHSDQSIDEKNRLLILRFEELDKMCHRSFAENKQAENAEWFESETLKLKKENVELQKEKVDVMRRDVELQKRYAEHMQEHKRIVVTRDELIQKDMAAEEKWNSWMKQFDKLKGRKGELITKESMLIESSKNLSINLKRIT